MDTRLQSNALPPITTLILNDNPLGFKSGELISTVIRNRPWHPMRTLHLLNCSLGAIGTNAMVECLKSDQRLFHVDLRKNNGFVRVQSACNEAVNAVSIRMSYVPFRTKLLFVWIMNIELVRMKKRGINECVSVDSRATSFFYNGMPPEVLRYILDFLSVTQTRHIVAFDSLLATNNYPILTPAEDPLFTARNGHWSLRDSSWV